MQNDGTVKQKADKEKSGSFVKRFFSALGPGLVTGAADDDPSGIVTYSIVGAGTGTTFLWMAWFTWPLMAAVQMMCARIGMATGQGLTVCHTVSKLTIESDMKKLRHKKKNSHRIRKTAKDGGLRFLSAQHHAGGEH